MLKKFLLLITMVIVLGCGNAYAQQPDLGLKLRWQGTTAPVVTEVQPLSPQAQDDLDEKKTQAQILAELRASRSVIAEKDKTIAALNGQIASQEKAITFIVEQRDFYKQASLERKQAGTLDDQNILLLRQQIADDRQEIKELRDDNDSLRRSRNNRTLLGLGLGGVLGFAVCKQ